MEINVFDDVKGSVAHIAAGGLTYFVPAIFVVFMLYEYVEYLYLSGREKQANFLGDIAEYSIGVMAMTVLVGIFGCFGAILFMWFVVFLWWSMRKWKKEVKEGGI